MPNLKRYIVKNNCSKTGYPLTSWVLFNSQGAVCDLSPAANLLAGGVELFNVSGTFNSTSQRLKVRSSERQYNESTPKARLCVDPPFLFLLFNQSEDIVNCSSQNCNISQCWNGKQFDTALVMRLPTFVPIPVKANPDSFPIMGLFRPRRDLGATAIIAAIAISAAAAATAGVAMASQVQTVKQVNDVIQQTANAFYVQEKINSHLASGILILNKRVDLVENSVQELFDVISISCVSRTAHICITPYPASLNESQQLSALLSGHWSRELEQLQSNFSLRIQVLNDTHLNIVTFGQFSNWLTTTFSFFKEWIGVGLFGALCVAGIALSLFLICRMHQARRREKVALARALAALEAGYSPQAWIAMYQRL